MKRVLVGLLIFGGLGCVPPKPPSPPGPTPKPSPTATPAPVPTPTPIVCASVDSFKLDTRKLARVIVDATPGSGFPGVNFKPLGPEGSGDRTKCEGQAGPYTWALDKVACNGLACDSGGNCLSNGGNPLQFVICKTGLVSVTAGNGNTSAVPVSVP